jgi:hypothetical protein
MGRGGLLQLRGMSWSPCCRSHPAEGDPSCQSAFDASLLPSPSGCRLGLRFFARSRPPLRSLPLRPADSRTILLMVWSRGFSILVSRHAALHATGLLTLPPTGLTPAEHTRLCWTHNRTCHFHRIRLARRLNQVLFRHTCHHESFSDILHR